MFHRVTLRVTDLERSRRFYALVLDVLGLEPAQAGHDVVEWSDFAIASAGDRASVTRRVHIGFVAPSRDHVDRFWRAGAEAGYHDDGRPGPRPVYGHDYYGGFLLDPDGVSAEAVHHDDLRQDGAIDHLWMRVGDVGASKRFYEDVAARAGFRMAHDTPERVRFTGASGSFSVLDDGLPASNVELAFPAAASATMTDPDGNRVDLVEPG
jgi:catechol 2,3-dioxygenase-like lactoylglutathione lyase family enzyme